MQNADAGYELVQGPDGTDLVVTGDWSQQAREMITTGLADGLVLNYAKGFRERDLRFLEHLPLKRLDILARTHAELDPIYSLAETLEDLNLQTAAVAIDVSRFPRLLGLGAAWAQVRESVSGAPKLNDLFLLAYGDSDLLPLAGNVELLSLRMKDRPRVRSLEGVEYLTKLRKLTMPMARVSDLGPLQSNLLLEVLDFSYCKQLTDLTPIEVLPKLTEIDFSECGDIATVRPLLRLPLVEQVYMWGSTDILDGDLAPIATLSRLRILRMTARKKYVPSVQSIKMAIGDI
jgi:hypothetical protein